MPIIAVSNRKGGTGKTTISTHLAGALAHRGHQVLLIDTDPQGHAAMCFGIRKEPGLFRLLVDSVDFQDVLREVSPLALSTPDDPPKGRLFILPSDEKTQAIPVLEKNPFALAQRLDEVAEIFQYVILDTAPTLTMFDGSVYLAAEAILYVTECESLSLDGLKAGIKQVTEFAPQRLQNRLPKTEILGIIPNKFRDKTANHVASLQAVREKYGDLVWAPLALRTILPEATTAGKLVFGYAPSSDAASAMWQIVSEFEKAVGVWQSA